MKFIRKFLNVIKSGITGVWKNKSMGLASVVSIAALLVILGLVLIAALSMNVILDDVQTRVDEIEIYLDDTLDERTIGDIQKNLEARPGVSEIRFKSKEDALNEMKEVWGEDAYILEGIEMDNPLERSLVVSVKDIEASDQIVEYAKNIYGITNVIYFQDTVNKILSITKYVRVGGLFVVFILIIISILVISNTVKLTVMARKREIEIMKYVGASNGMISGPFIIEGVVFGLLGAGLGYVITHYSYGFIYDIFNDRLHNLLSSYLIKPGQLTYDLLIIFATLGVVVGTVGSVFSLKKYLKV